MTLMTAIYEDVTLRLPRNVLIESLAAASGTQTLSEYVAAALQAANTPAEAPAEPDEDEGLGTKADYALTSDPIETTEDEGGDK